MCKDARNYASVCEGALCENSREGKGFAQSKHTAKATNDDHHDDDDDDDVCTEKKE